MISRRGFLGGILAAMAAPAVVKSGILMPVKRPIYTGEIGIIESVRFIQSGPALVLRDAAGVALCTIPMGEPRVEQFDYGHKLGMVFDGGTGDVLRTGTAHSFEMIGAGAHGNIKGKVGRGGLLLDTPSLVTGQNVTITNLAYMRDRVFDNTPEPFDDRAV